MSAGSTANRLLHLRPGFHVHRQLLVENHLHRRRQGRTALSRLPDRAARREIQFRRGLLPAAQRRAADQGRVREIPQHHHAPHHGARADDAVLHRLPPRRASDGHHVRLGRRAVGLLSRLHRHQRSPAAHDRQPSPDRQDADDRGHGLQVFHRPALHLSAQRSRLHVQLPADVLRRSVRALSGQPDGLARARPHPDPARRPRAECLDLHRPPRRLVRRQSVRLHRRRHRLPVGPGARRRQRGRAEDAGGDRHGRSHARVRQEGEGQELRVPPDGLRPSRLQELRPARQGHGSRPATRCSTRSASRTSTC